MASFKLRLVWAEPARASRRPVPITFRNVDANVRVDTRILILPGIQTRTHFRLNVWDEKTREGNGEEAEQASADRARLAGPILFAAAFLQAAVTTRQNLEV